MIMYLCFPGDLISTPERLITGTVAGLTLGIDAEDDRLVCTGEFVAKPSFVG